MPGRDEVTCAPTPSHAFGHGIRRNECASSVDMPHLELRGLTKRYGTSTPVDAIDFTVERGEFICLLGPSGCGKTTTLRLLAGFLTPDEGEIRVAGKVISSPGAVTQPERRNMGMIFQSYAVWPHMTVRENVRSEEHTSELQSLRHLVCRLLLEKKKYKQ